MIFDWKGAWENYTGHHSALYGNPGIDFGDNIMLNSVKYFLTKGMSLGPEQVLGNLLIGRLSTLSEKISDGKSGSFFFFSHDGKFMAKTISKGEGNNFRNLLPHYYKVLTFFNQST